MASFGVDADSVCNVDDVVEGVTCRVLYSTMNEPLETSNGLPPHSCSSRIPTPHVTLLTYAC